METASGFIAAEQSAWPTMLVPLGLAALGLSLLGWRRGLLAGTTLLAPWCWIVVALVFVAAVEVAAGLASIRDPVWVGPFRLVAAVSTFCPIVSLLGAKRPQDRVWQLIVLALWGILALPAAEVLLLRPGTQLQIEGARSWFLLLLLVVCTVNGLPTRFGLSAALYGLAQIFLLAGQLPLLRWSADTWSAQLGLVLLVAALLLVAIGFPPSRPVRQPSDRPWVDFRDMFGALWGLRMMERVNHASETCNWNIKLWWRGFRVDVSDRGTGEMAPEAVEQLQKTMNSLLRRFVSREWIAARLEQPARRS